MNTMQFEFDAVVAHLYRQGMPARSSGKYGSCVYRSNTGLSCAVGCRIPDSMYMPKMDTRDGTGILQILSEFEFPEEIYEYVEMFQKLQTAHDCCLIDLNGCFKMDDLQNRLSSVAQQFNLTFTIPQ